jgi:dihydrofolate reductase
MLIYSMNVSVDGFIADREGGIGWTAPSEEEFRFHLAQVRELGACLLGRRLYEAVQLDLIETTTFGSRVIYERYARARND